MNNWHVVLKSMFCFDNHLLFAKTFEEEKLYVMYGSCIIMHVNTMFTGLSEIYAWRGQTPFVMSIAAIEGNGLLTIDRALRAVNPTWVSVVL